MKFEEHSTSICKVYDENQSKIEEFLRKESLRGFNLLIRFRFRFNIVFIDS